MNSSNKDLLMCKWDQLQALLSSTPDKSEEFVIFGASVIAEEVQR